MADPTGRPSALRGRRLATNGHVLDLWTSEQPQAAPMSRSRNGDHKPSQVNAEPRRFLSEPAPTSGRVQHGEPPQNERQHGGEGPNAEQAACHFPVADRTVRRFVDRRTTSLLAFVRILTCRELEGIERELAGT
jgi:hypothetical protein